jgi:hypothetical protein
VSCSSEGHSDKNASKFIEATRRNETDFTEIERDTTLNKASFDGKEAMRSLITNVGFRCEIRERCFLIANLSFLITTLKSMKLYVKSSLW